MMAKYRNNLPQLSGKLFLTDGGLETTLIFHDKIELPYFASFDLLRTVDGTRRLRDYFERYIAMAKRSRTGFVLEAPTWRANPDWAKKLGYSFDALEQVNRDAMDLLAELRFEHDTPQTPMVISGNIGPRGDGYKVENAMSAREAQDYHGWQVGVFARTEADLVSAFTINYAEEAIGVARACQAASMPCVISFTVETDGKLPSGQTLRDAIEQTDRATGNGPAYYMLNCAHPAHFADALKRGEAWTERLRGLRANASMRSHAELDAAPDLDIGDPADLGARYRALRREFPRFTVLGGCCGTDHRHVEQICLACVEVEQAA
jgi:homocysteine S-methyltransferase